MPCQGGMSFREVVVESGEVIDDLTQKLCYLCASLYADDLLKKYASPDIVKWHKEHMHKDEIRVSHKMQELYRDNPHRLGDPKGVAKEFLDKALEVHPVSRYHRKWFRKMARDVAKSIKDAKRVNDKIKVTRAKAIKKLTAAEKQALGL